MADEPQRHHRPRRHRRTAIPLWRTESGVRYLALPYADGRKDDVDFWDVVEDADARRPADFWELVVEIAFDSHEKF